VTSQARSALRTVARAYDRALPTRTGTTVLLYHRVGGRTPVPVDLPTERFREQIASIASRAVTLDEAIDDDRADAPPRVVVTFDDGTADVVEEALPILVEHAVPAVLYVATRFVEEQRDFPDDGKVVSWAALRDAVSTGLLTLGSHTHGHALLDRLDPAEVPDELDRSIDLIGERVGVAAEHFAYPKALPGSPAATAEVRRRFRSAAVAGTRVNPAGRLDPWHLHRSPIQVADGPEDFARKAAGGLRIEDDLRRLVNRVRYRGATS